MKNVLLSFALFCSTFVVINGAHSQTATTLVTLPFGTGYDATITLTTPTILTTWELKLTISGVITPGGYVLFNGGLFPSSNYSQSGTTLTINNAGLSGYSIPSSGSTVIGIRSITNATPSVVLISFPTSGSGNNGNTVTDIWLSSGANAYLNPTYTKLGIGVDNPQFPFEVVGLSKLKGKATLGNDVLQLFYPDLVNGRNHYMYFSNRFFENSTTQMYSTIGAYDALPNTNGTAAQEGPRPLILQSQFLESNLGVGYHVTPPTAKLSVMGNSSMTYIFKVTSTSTAQKAMSVSNGTTDVFRVMGDGKIWTPEVNVKIAGQFPDYVFAKDYQLMPLSELENYILKNSRLPNMPSASEVAENGVNLGELNKNLVEKVEELTLYTIQQQKLIEELAKRLAELEKKQ